MFFVNCALVTFVTLHNVVGDSPNIRILAPEFVCPKDEDALIDKPDNTIITLQTAADENLRIKWTVRWTHLPAPSQRSTLLLWRAVRALEKILNGPQPELFVYVIDNAELLSGVNYIFYVTAISSDGVEGTPKSFQINNTHGDPKVTIEGRSDMFSVLLLGGQSAYADMEYVLEAQVTTCHLTQDYYFKWAVNGAQTNKVNLTDIKGSRLQVPAYSFRAGQTYNVSCLVLRQSSGELITQTHLIFQVLHKGLEVSLNMDTMVVSINTAFSLESTIINHDYYNDLLTFKWNCSCNGVPCESFESINDQRILFPDGLPEAGYYKITLTVNVLDHVTKAASTIIAVEQTLPVLQISPISRVLNENTVVSLVANASNVAPACTLTWYYTTEEYLSSNLINETCADSKHGEALSDSLTVYSLEENFLNELTDYSNETEWRQVTAYLKASVGRARFVAECGCSLTFSCDTAGTAYADISFQLNTSPKPGNVNISPESGLALETMFRISTLAVMDGDHPLRYSFYCRVGTNDSLLLGSFMEHLAVETCLPYVDGLTDIWVEVCDAQGACAAGDAKSVEVTSGEARTFEALVEDIRAHVRRCEMMLLQKVAVSAIVTYTNAGQSETLSQFTTALLVSLSTIDKTNCINNNSEQYFELLNWLACAGIDISSFVE